MAWRWIQDGDKSGVQLNGEFHESLGLHVEKKIELANRLNLQAAVWSILYSARSAFAIGNASYHDACDNLAQLVAELFRAITQLEQTLSEVGALFQPVLGLSPLERMEDRIDVAKLAVQNIAPPLPPAKRVVAT